MNRRVVTRLGLATALVACLLVGLPAEAQQLAGTWESSVWTSDRTGGARISLSLRMDRRGDRLNHGFSPEAGDLEGISLAELRADADDVEFRLVREAGVLTFRGEIRDGRGQGTFDFAPSDQYRATMAGLGFPDISGNRLLMFATLDVTTDYVLEIHRLGYRSLDEERLASFAIHGVSAEFIREMNDLGYTDIPAGDLVQLRIHGVSPEWVRRIRAALGTR